MNLTINRGEIHALMGPNGSGKSTLSNVLMGHPSYEITQGSVTFLGEDITKATPNSRATMGMFLAFQYPEEIPGVSVVNFLRAALSNKTGTDYTVLELRLKVMDAMAELGMDSSFATATSTRGSPAVSESATRCCKWPSSNPSWQSWMRQTLALISTPSRSSQME